MPAKKKKEGMLGKAIRGLNKTNVATGVKPIRVTKKRAKPTKKKKVVNRNKALKRPLTTTAAKAKAQKAAIRKKTAARVAKAKRKK